MTTDEKHAASRSKQHTVYKNKAGQRVPGTTTITAVMDKPALVLWANKLGLAGIDSTKYVDELATIGILAHYMIECHCKNIIPDLNDYSQNQISLANNSFKKWVDWQKTTGFIPVHNELQLVSEKYQFGGTIDIIGIIKGKVYLIDIKTCKGIYGEQKTQVAGGYNILGIENYYNIDHVVIIRVGRNDDEGFEQINISTDECLLHQKRFLICRELYEINKQIGK